MANAVIYYNWIGKDVMDGSSVYYTVYGNMLWQTLPSVSWITYTDLRMSWETSYDLYWFQPWHTVLWYVVTLASNSDSWTYEVKAYLQYKSWSSRYSTWDAVTYTWTTSTNQVRKWFRQIWIKSNNIRPSNWDTYRIYTTWKVWSYTGTDKIENFTVSNLYIDDTVYTPWNMTISWTNIVYTDTFWAKHIVAYDGNYSWSHVWTDHSWFIRLDPYTARRLYYVDQFWYVRRTYEASNWRDYTSWQWRNVWSDYKGSLRSWWPNDTWQRYLCFVNNSWYAMRLMNWNPNWTE